MLWAPREHCRRRLGGCGARNARESRRLPLWFGTGKGVGVCGFTAASRHVGRLEKESVFADGRGTQGRMGRTCPGRCWPILLVLLAAVSLGGITDSISLAATVLGMGVLGS